MSRQGKVDPFQASRVFVLTPNITRDEQVFVNGKSLVMDGWPQGRRISERSWKLLGIQLKNYDNTVPKNNVIVMGDNTRKSYDSGDFGMLSISQISGHINP